MGPGLRTVGDRPTETHDVVSHEFVLRMIISRNVAPFVINEDDTVLAALQKISSNQSRVVFCVTSSGSVSGIMTDGDFRRWVIAGGDVDLQQPVSAVANDRFLSASPTDTTSAIAAMLSPRVRQLPLLDDRKRLVGIAMEGEPRLIVGDRVVDQASRPLLIAEIGNNHQGDMAMARELVDVAVDAGAGAVKFQLRDLSSLYRGDGAEDLSAEYTLDMLEKYSFGPDQMLEILDYCRTRDMLAFCTPWDLASLDVLERGGVPAYKIASADLTNHALLRAAAQTGKPLIVSTGMSSEQEIIESIAVLRSEAAAFALLHTNSTYPAPFKDINLRYLERLRELGECPVGYSGHERGIHVAVAAVAAGAKIIEKHLTLDRSLEGADHKVSLLPDELADLVTALDEVESALGSAEPREVSQGESMNRANLAKSLVAVNDMLVGHVVTEADVEVKSPGRGLQPNRLADLVGTPLRRPIEAGDFFFPSDVDGGASTPRDYSFRRPWGLPVRYHDVESISARAKPDLLEFHLSYRDLNVDPNEFIFAEQSGDLVVHSPEMFEGDFLLDLAADDAATRRRSERELQRVVVATRALRPWFPNANKPYIIVNVGGFSSNRAMDVSERAERYRRVAESLEAIDEAGVQIIPQSMPPFPWLRGGQMHHNLFVDPYETAAFCREFDRQICLDVSHSVLAANHLGTSFRTFVDIVGPHTAYCHLVDGAGVDEEGLQIGDGEIDWSVLAEQLDRHAPTAGFIPEIWQGHINNGEGFWIALDRLEKFF